MGSGGGFNKLINESLNVLTNFSTGGVVGFEDGGFGQGVATKAAVDITKEVTGAKAAEEANELARQQAEEAKAQADQDRANAQEMNRRQQVQASRAAGAARGGRSSNYRADGNLSLSSDETDFLGL